MISVLILTWCILDGFLPQCNNNIRCDSDTSLKFIEGLRNHATDLLLLLMLQIHLLPKFVCRPKPIQIPAKIIFRCYLISRELSVQ